jgi:hypothetical protein
VLASSLVFPVHAIVVTVAASEDRHTVANISIALKVILGTQEVCSQICDVESAHSFVEVDSKQGRSKPLTVGPLQSLQHISLFSFKHFQAVSIIRSSQLLTHTALLKRHTTAVSFTPIFAQRAASVLAKRLV